MNAADWSVPHSTTARRLAALGIVAILLAGCGGGKDAPAARSVADSGAQTILLVTIDTLRADRVGCYGRENAGTPAIDALAAAGTVFESAHASSPLTLPSHTSMLTGRSLPAHGIFNNGTFALPDGVDTLATRLAGAGFATGAFVSSPVLARRHGLAQGFAVYDDDIPRPAQREGLVVHYEERAGQETARRALAWLAAQGTRPAFVWVHVWEPHAPYTPPAEFRERFGDDRYQGEVAAADAVVGRLVREIESMGRKQGLLAVVTADHGEGLGEHGEPTHGVFLYQATMRVPLVVSGQGWGVKSQRIAEPASLEDIAPTLLEFAKQPPLAGADGASLAPALTGAGPMPARAGVFAESHLPRIEFGWSGLRAFVDKDGLKLIDAPRRELFDLAADPAESNDLRAARAADADRLAGALAARVTAAEERLADYGTDTAVSEEDLARLRSLGYAASGRRLEAGAMLVDPQLADPKDRREFIARFDGAVGMALSGRAAEAEAVFAELAKVDPENPTLLKELGQAQILGKRFDEAIATFRKLVTVDPGFGSAWYRLGQLYDQKKDVPAAEASYRRAAAVDPVSTGPRKALASLLAEAGRIREAIDVLEEAKRIDPRDPAIQRDLDRYWAQIR